VAGAPGSLYGFPASLTSFVGRAQATHQIAAKLAEYRLVTLTGPGGAGKTRLAGEVAKQVAGRFADGVWLAELAAVRDPAHVPAAVAAALGIHDLPVVAASDALAHALARRQLLLVLDNCEQVIGAAAEVCGRLLLGADDVRVLATSREPLRIAGEVRYRLGPLTLPDPGTPGNPDDPAGSEAESEAVTLFTDRARRAEPGFTLDRQTRKTVDQLVARLDGMPLAIELAAAVQWSYELLDAEEQRMFRAVSVFPGPFTLDGAEAVAGPAACQTVPRLVDCSLLVPPRAGADVRTRYTMLESLRAYGSGLLAEAGEDGQAAAALAGYVAELAEQTSAGLHTRTQEAASLRLFDAEETSMRHALAWAMEHDPALALRLALTQSQWWLLPGPPDQPGAAAGRGRRARRCRQQRVVHRPDAARPGRLPAGRAGRRRGALHHSSRCPRAHPPADRPGGPAPDDALPGRPVSGAAADGPGGRGGRGCPPGDGRGPPGQLSGPGGNRPDLRQHGRLAGRRPGRRAPACAPGAGCLGRLRGRAAPGPQPVRDDDHDRDRRPGRRRAGLRGRAGLVAGSGRPDEPERPALEQGVPGPAASRIDDATAHLRELLQIGTQTGLRPIILASLDCCGHLCAATGRPAEAITAWAAASALSGPWPLPYDTRNLAEREELQRNARERLGPAAARAAGERGAAMSLATAAEYALLLAAAQPPAESPAEPPAELPAEPPPPPAPALPRLSPRERELVTLVAQGRTDAQIAAQLYITVRTVSSHLDRIRDKTGCRRRADLTRLALTAGLV
jgi:predicted ATPase/DNA-binding CsgD family transcriptional regulator